MTMETKSVMESYDSPRICEIEIESEGILCSSPGGIGDGEDGGDL